METLTQKVFTKKGKFLGTVCQIRENSVLVEVIPSMFSGMCVVNDKNLCLECFSLNILNYKEKIN